MSKRPGILLIIFGLLSFATIDQATAQTTSTTLPTIVTKSAEIAHQLDAAKALHRQDIEDAKKALLHAIDDRVNAAADAGDLDTVKSLREIRLTAAVDASVSDDVKDAAVVKARRSYEASIASANVGLNEAYQKAVRDFTRDREIALAEATQAEMNSLDLVDPNAPSSMTVGTYQLASRLPDFLIAKDSNFVSLADQMGIIVPQMQFIRTREADLLNKNFTADFWFYMVKGMRNYAKLSAAVVGLGEGTLNPVNHGPQDALYLEINPPDQNGGEVSLHQRTASEKTIFGHLKEFDTYVVRIQKSGDAVTFTVGTEQSGMLVPEAFITVDNLRSTSPYLNESNTHLFFGSGAFGKLSIGKGPTPAKAVVDAKPLIPAPNSVETPAKSDGKSFSPRIINLLQLCDPKRDAVKGAWRMEDGELYVNAAGGPQLDFPYKPPAEYDYIVDFTRGDNQYGTTFIFSHGDRTMLWGMEGLHGKGSHFAQLPDELQPKAQSTFHMESNHRYRLKIEVRNNRVTAIVDDKVIVNYPTNYAEFRETPPAMQATRHIAFLDWWANVQYHKVEIVELSGPGSYLPSGSDIPQQMPERAINAAIALPVSSTTSTPVSITKNDFAGWQCIINKGTGRYLWITSDNKNQGNVVKAQPSNDSDNEEWKISAIARFDGVKLSSKYSNKCIGVREGSNKPGQDVVEWVDWKPGIVYDKPAGNNWRIVPVGDCFKFVAEMSGQCLTDTKARDDSVMQEPWKGSDDQLWRIEPAK